MYIYKKAMYIFIQSTCVGWESKDGLWMVEARTATIVQKPKNRNPLFFLSVALPFLLVLFPRLLSLITPSTSHLPNSPMTQTMASHLDIRGASLGCLRILPDDLIIRAIFSHLGPKVYLSHFLSLLLR